MLTNEVYGGSMEHPSSKSSAPVPLGELVGRNVWKLREERGLTQEGFMMQGRSLGLNWSRSRLSLLENGSIRDVSVTDLVVLAAVLQARIERLLQGAGPVRLPAGGWYDLGDLEKFLAGGPPVQVQGGPSHAKVDLSSSMSVADGGHPFEIELAQRFGVPVREIRYSAQNLYNRSLVDERDRRVRDQHGELSKEQRTAYRGHVARVLADEIHAELEKRNQV